MNEGAATKPLQHFEFQLLLAVEALGTEAFPAELARRLTHHLGRHVSLAQVFVALERLEDKGCVSSETVIPDPPVRGGRRRRVFRVEPNGAKAIRVTTTTYDRAAPAAKAETAYEERRRRREPATA
ncbi:hypothetical protein [Reyranella sp.]|uniref:hypothetical protein n=1 Tax=Reyranella sp. TaxID=1929291 RepID=UPI004036197F